MLQNVHTDMEKQSPSYSFNNTHRNPRDTLYLPDQLAVRHYALMNEIKKLEIKQIHPQTDNKWKNF